MRRLGFLFFISLFLAVPIAEPFLANTAFWQVPGLTPAGAYSVRRLIYNYAGMAMQVRRSSDNTTQNIGYTGAGDLDTAGLTTFCGSNTCYVTIWYDQSGAANNAVQASNGNQAIIVNSGTINTVNTKPALLFSGSQYYIATLSSLSATTSHTLAGVAKGAGAFAVLSNTSAANQNSALGTGETPGGAGAAGWYGGYAQDAPYGAGSTNNLLNSLAKTFQNGSCVITGYFNNTSIFTNSGTCYNLTSANIDVGSQNGSGNQLMNGSISESIVYLFALTSTQLTNLYNSEKAYFSTP